MLKFENDRHDRTDYRELKIKVLEKLIDLCKRMPGFFSECERNLDYFKLK